MLCCCQCIRTLLCSRMDLLVVFWLLVLLQQQRASPLMSPTAEKGLLAQLPHEAHRREKRCSCENQKDKECIFFCHIGIVWVNTPSHVVPYGVGSVRLKRELRRCFCTRTQDAECVGFCSLQTEVHHDAMKRATRHRVAFWEKRSALKRQT